MYGATGVVCAKGGTVRDATEGGTVRDAIEGSTVPDEVVAGYVE